VQTGLKARLTEHEHLHQAFEAVYLDLCGHGICRWDPVILERLWLEFLADMNAGFPSLFKQA